MSFTDTTEQMVGILPVVVTAGVAMKMVDWMGTKMQPVSTKKSKPKKDVYNRSYAGSFGNFSNLGY